MQEGIVLVQKHFNSDVAFIAKVNSHKKKFPILLLFDWKFSATGKRSINKYKRKSDRSIHEDRVCVLMSV